MKPEIPVAVSRFLKKGVRVVSSGVLFVVSVVSPIDSPVKVNAAESNLQQNVLALNDPTWLQGDGLGDQTSFLQPDIQVPTGEYQTIRGVSSDGVAVELTQIYKGEGVNKTTAEIFLYNYDNYQQGKDAAKKMVEYFFQPYPLNNHLKDYDFWVRNPAGMEDLLCGLRREGNNNNFHGSCPQEPFEREIDRVISATKMIPQETFVLIKSNTHGAGGQGSVEAGFYPPSIYNMIGVVLPINLISDNQKMAPAHEWGARMGFIDSNDQTSIMGNVGARRFNDTESAWIEQVFANNWKYNHLTPGLEARSRAGTSSLNIKQQAELLPDLNLISLIYSPEGTEQIKIHITPANNDGPDIPIQLGSLTGVNQPLRHALTETGLIFRESVMGQGPYIVLPDMTYTWTVCASGQLVTPLPWNSEKWEEAEIWPGRKISYPCQKIEMKTAKTDSTTITPITLANGEQTNNLTPTLRWDNSRKNIFYYEIRVSKDPQFGPNAFLYNEQIHGGVTNPDNSYKIPREYPLEQNTTYYWDIRPIVQGDGTPLEKRSIIGSFKTSQDARVLAANEFEMITQPIAKRIITKEQHEKNMKLAQTKDAHRLMSMWAHWDQVNQKVLEDIAAYRREEQQFI